MSVRRTVIALTALALLLRVATLDVQSFWSDEAASGDVLRHSFGGMIHAVWDGESTPPLWYVIAWLWSKLAGTGEVALRLPSAVFGTATVPVVAALAARVAAPLRAERADRAAVLAAALAAVGPLMVWYGQEARAYALLMLLAAGSTLALLRALDSPTRGRLAVWAVLAVAAFWAHHFALFLVVGQALWVVWRLRERALAAVGAVALGGVALAPLLLHQRDAGRATFIGDVPLHTRLAQVPKQILVGYDGPLQTVLAVLGAAAVVVAAAGLVAAVRGRERALAGPGLVVVTIAGGGLLLPALAAAVGQDFLLTRNLLGLLPLVLALIGAGLALLPAGRSAVAGAVAAAVMMGTGLLCAVAVAVHPGYQRDDFRAAIDAVLKGADAPRLVVTSAGGRVPATFYLGRGTKTVVPGQAPVVREVDVVLVAGAEPGRARSTPTLREDYTPSGFTLAGVDHGETWAVRRYLTPAAIPVDPAGVAPLVPQNPIVLYHPR